jgi:cohesin complex subunit SCC1
MFYSQIILAKKGPLGKVWLAAHWGDKKLGRKQVFTTDIAMSVDTICNPAVPLALRVSGHLLLGVVRIYSHQVKFLMRDCEEAMVKIKLAFRPEGEGQAEDAQEYNYNVMDDGNGIGNTGRNHLNVQNFGDISLMPQQFDLSGGGGPIGIGGILVQPVTMEEDGDVFHVPFDLDGKYEYQGNNGEWVEAVDEEGFGDGYGTGNNDFGRKKARRAMELKSQNSQDGSQSLDFHVDNSAIAAVNMTLDSEMMGDGTQRMDEEEENWHAFDPEEDEEEDGERHVFDASDPNADGGLDVTKDTLGTDVSNIELVRADESGRVSMVSTVLHSTHYTREQ